MRVGKQMAKVGKESKRSRWKKGEERTNVRLNRGKRDTVDKGSRVGAGGYGGP
jgi:hypothetical protein